MTRYVVIGAGIIGLATAHRLTLDYPHATVTVLDKEPRVGAHQTGHNSGVIHAGVYYRPGSLKATLCRAGAASMVRFCAEHAIPVQTCGKLIVATEPSELPGLLALHHRAQANKLAATLIGPEQAREYEPHVACRQALRVASTGIVDYAQVCRVLADLVQNRGGEVRLATPVTGFAAEGGASTRRVLTKTGDLAADVVINCAGLHADRIARLAGIRPPARIVPFRGEYYELVPERRHLVRGLIYPVPDPALPFLGVHLTRGIDGHVHAGPNAVLALSREGYGWTRLNPRDLAEAAAYPGLWRLARRNLGNGFAEVRRSLSPKLFARSLARLVPELGRADLTRAGAGVRAQAIAPDGSMVDDFLIVRAPGHVHVLNAPSPAATSALEIAKHIVAEAHR
jgi:(S)-2-hydroxyglutarate dehydrogenase